jgi:hypothetical protein
MAGLLDIIGRMDTEQLRKLVESADTPAQGRPDLPSWMPSPIQEDQFIEGLERLDGREFERPFSPPQVQIPVYDIDGFRYETMQEQMVPWYDTDGLRYVYPSQMKDNKLRQMLKGLL